YGRGAIADAGSGYRKKEKYGEIEGRQIQDDRFEVYRGEAVADHREKKDGGREQAPQKRAAPQDGRAPLYDSRALRKPGGAG
ncbi:MAG: hypothetical protein ACREMY_20310, partial [bacterium]